MPATEPIQGGPYPEPSDAPDGPNQMSAITAWAAGRLVMRFASTTARDAAITSPVEGMRAVTGTGTGLAEWQYRDGSWRNVTIGEPTPYTPALTASTTSPTLGAGSANGEYARSGDWITGWATIVLGVGATAGSGTYYVSMPVEMADASAIPTIGTAHLFSGGGSGTWQHAVVIPASTTTVQFRTSGATPTVGAAAPFSWVATCQLRVFYAYRAAA